MFKWLITNGCQVKGEYCTVMAACGGHLDSLKYLRANGYDWEKSVCSGAAENGQLGVLKWSVANGCDWEPYYCELVARINGKAEVVQWIRAHDDFDGSLHDEDSMSDSSSDDDSADDPGTDDTDDDDVN